MKVYKLLLGLVVLALLGGGGGLYWWRWYTTPEPPRVALEDADPGVVEVNIHPAHSWDQLVANTSVIYEEARASRLVT